MNTEIYFEQRPISQSEHVNSVTGSRKHTKQIKASFKVVLMTWHYDMMINVNNVKQTWYHNYIFLLCIPSIAAVLNIFTPHCSQQYLKNPLLCLFWFTQKNVQRLKWVTKIVRIKIVIIHHILEFWGELKGIFLHVLYGDCNQGRCC